MSSNPQPSKPPPLLYKPPPPPPPPPALPLTRPNLTLRRTRRASPTRTKAQTPLHVILQQNTPDTPFLLLSYLLRHPGADVNARDGEGRTLLSLAASLPTPPNSTPYTSLLLPHPRLQPLFVDNQQRTPLHYAVLASSQITTPPTALQSLLDFFTTHPPSFNPFLPDKDGVTPLHLACALGNEAALMALLEYRGRFHSDLGADRKDAEGNEPLHYLCSSTPSSLLKSWNVSEPTDVDWARMVRLYLDRLPSIDLEATDKKGDTPLVMAVKAGRTEVVKVLLSFGADPEASGWPLMCAVTSGHLSLVEVLVAWGVDLDRTSTPMDQEDGGGSVLSRAVSLWAETVQAGADAGTWGRIVEVLVRNNADIDIPNEGALDYPLHIAARVVETPETVDPDLVEYCVIPPKRAAKKEAGSGPKAMLDILLSSFNPATQTPDYDPNTINSAGNTPLHEAVLSRNEEGVKILSDPKLAGVEYVNAMGETPLLVAVGLEWAEGVGVLLQAGADGEVVDELGMTPLRLAIEQGWMEGVKALLDGGVDVGKDIWELAQEKAEIEAVLVRWALLDSEGEETDEDTEGESEDEEEVVVREDGEEGEVMAWRNEDENPALDARMRARRREFCG